MPKEQLDAKKALSIEALNDLKNRINQSAFTLGDIINVSINDISQITTAFEFMFTLKGDLQDIRKSIESLEKKVGK